jgi:peptidyl-prolyl cis-trans isomerase B (cyclophilin B)
MPFLFLMTICRAQVKKQVKKPPVKKATSVKPRLKAKPAVPIAVQPVRPQGVRVKITTDMGEIIVRLSDKTPRHRDNFIKLVNEHFYDSLIFHRIIANFMIQGGDPQSKNALPGIMLGRGDVGYTIPAEFDSTLYHKKGALAAARTNNPERASSGCQFYIVHGKTYGDDELNMIQMQNGTYFSPAKKMTYKMVGGTPALDMNYTVFGEVEKGLEVVDLIARSQTNNFERPVQDIHMKMEVMTEEDEKGP